NVDRGHLRAKGPSQLHCKVSHATYPENSQALTGHNPGALQGAINGESRTKKRGGFERRKTIWNFQRVSCRRLDKFGVATVNGDTCDLLPVAQDHRDRKSTRLNSSHGSISYAVFCLKKKNTSNKI